MALRKDLQPRVRVGRWGAKGKNRKTKKDVEKCMIQLGGYELAHHHTRARLKIPDQKTRDFIL